MLQKITLGYVVGACLRDEVDSSRIFTALFWTADDKFTFISGRVKIVRT